MQILLIFGTLSLVVALPAPDVTQVPILKPQEDATEVDLDVIVGKIKGTVRIDWKLTRD